MDKEDIKMKSVEIQIPTDMEENIQLALNETGFGKFNLKVMVLCCLVYLNTAVCICSIGFILPSAACDFQMTTIQKGKINIISLTGMAAGCYFWGCYAGIKGRINTLTISMFLQGGFEILSGIAPNYEFFLLFKFLSGFSLSGQSGTLFVYLGECQPTKYKERLLSWLEMAWTLGLIVVPVVGWIIIPLQFNINAKLFSFHSWNLFVIICSLPALIIGFWALYFPESPKFLAEKMEIPKLGVVLGKIYVENTGNPEEKYFEILAKNKNPLYDMLKTNSYTNSNEKIESWRSIIYSMYIQVINLFKLPHLTKSLNIFTLISCTTASYYTLMLWFPELFQRFAKYENLYPGKSTSVCEISNINLFDNNKTSNVDYDIYNCQNSIQDKVFFHTLLLGLGCLPLSIVLPFTVQYTGYKIYLIICTFLSGVATIGFYFIRSSIQNLIISSIFEALTSICMSISLCIVVDIFPTNLRMMATSVAAFCARVGAFTGNWIFGYLIDNYCLTLIIIVTTQLFLCTILSFLVPGRFIGRKTTNVK